MISYFTFFQLVYCIKLLSKKSHYSKKWQRWRKYIFLKLIDQEKCVSTWLTIFPPQNLSEIKLKFRFLLVYNSHVISIRKLEISSITLSCFKTWFLKVYLSWNLYVSRPSRILDRYQSHSDKIDIRSHCRFTWLNISDFSLAPA